MTTAGDAIGSRFVVGCMTGTSIDAIDAACMEIQGAGLEMRATLRGFASRPLGELATTLRALAAQQPMSAREIAGIAHAFSSAHIEAIRQAAGDHRLRLIAVHGQTLFHDPPVSWQLINPTVIAAELCVTVVSDLRAADIAAGGQGAPITPLADWVLFRDARESRAVVNLGGFSNYTFLPADGGPEAVTGGDICVCNQLLDAVARRYLNRNFDKGGACAAAGKVDSGLLIEMCGVLESQSAAQRSLGTRDERLTRLDEWGQTIGANDLARTACEAVARVVVSALPRADRVLLAGGGALNSTLVAAIQRGCGIACEITDRLGISVETREAAEMAILGALSADRVAITLPRVTGARRSVLSGVWVHNPESDSGG